MQLNLRGKELKNYKNSLTLSQFQRDLVIGSVLGDGNLRFTNKNREANFIVEHSLKQEEYVEWKYQHLKEFVLTPPKIVKRVYHKDRSKITIGYRFLTISHPVFTEFSKIFYKNGYKEISPATVVLISSPLILACWIMDDGNRNHDALFLNTQQFSLSEQGLLKEWLKKRFGLQISVNKHHHGMGNNSIA